MTKRFSRGALRALSRALSGVLCAAAVLGLAACDLDLINPNAPSEEEVLGSSDLLLTTAVGIQAQYAENLNLFLRAPALVTDEWGTRSLALAADVSLVTGTPDPAFGVVSDPFAAAYRIARTADILVANAPGLSLGAGLQAGVTSLSRLLKAMALGHIYIQYERAPVNFDPNGAVPQPRAVVLDTVISILEAARSDVATVPDADLAGFRSRVLGTGFDLRNTTDAMLARYYLFDGRYQNAIDAAGRVNLGVLSVLSYPNPGINPVYNYSVLAQYTGTRKSFFTEAQPGDQRPAYWANRSTGYSGNPPTVIDSVFAFRQYSNRNDPYPLYLPDEMRLVQAEAYTRLGNLAQARTLVNTVRTQCSSALNEPMACLPALPVTALDTEAELLTEILYQRRYELYAQGLRWEDLRRLQQYTTRRPSIPFLPYPQSECDRNPAQPCG
ncbi:MAG TPA: RagB/SusD family nutrient uptake outer membrane protein [Longimicrobiaceae bacterium]|nr:RagB/SusD family nutrient uptake outer membrane protein [Longimicrobiaceae bacterium]